MWHKFRLSILIVVSTMTTLLSSRPAFASSIGGCDLFLHTNTNTGYISYLATDSPPCASFWSPNDMVFTTLVGNNEVIEGDHALGLWHSSQGWTVFNEDIAPVASQAQFMMLDAHPVQLSYDAVYTHIASISNSSNWGATTTLDNPVLNGHPEALVIIDPAYLPNYPVRDSHPLGVWYDTAIQRWVIYHADGTPIPNNAAYFVAAEIGVGAPNFLTVSSTTNQLFGKVVIDDTLTNNNPNIAIFVTQELVGTYDPHNVGVEKLGGYWCIYNLDGSPIPTGVNFQVYVP